VLTRLIVDLYTWIIEIALWFMLLISAVLGYRLTVPMLRTAGWIPTGEGGWSILGGVLGVVGAFLMLAVLVGPVLLLVEIRRSVKLLEANRDGVGRLHTERTDPPLGMPREFRL
jgi:hypothetical protein